MRRVTLIRKRPSHLWIVKVPRSADDKVEPRQLTYGRFDEGDAAWSRDGAQLYFTSWHVDEPYYELPKTELYAIPVKGGEAKLMHHHSDEHRQFRAQPGWQTCRLHCGR
jgi:hypothetical protein